MAPAANEARLRWLLTEAARNVGLILTTNMINKVCAAESKLMHDNGMVLMWQTTVDETATQMEPTGG